MTDQTQFCVDIETLGYAIGKLLSTHSNLRSQRSLENATKEVVSNLGISLTAMSSKELETLFYNVGRGYAKPFST